MKRSLEQLFADARRYEFLYEVALMDKEVKSKVVAQMEATKDSLTLGQQVAPDREHFDYVVDAGMEYYYGLEDA